MSYSIGEHVPCPAGTLLNHRWLVKEEIGSGNFAKVYRCVDTVQPEEKNVGQVAVKIIKREYAEDGDFENRILRVVNQLVPPQYKVIRKLDRTSFLYHDCMSIVFELKGCTLRQCHLGVYEGSVTLEMIQQFAREMLTTLSFLHEDLRLVHTDLKPENILLDDGSAAGVAGVPERGIGNSWTFADFGSASFYSPERADTDLISTRPYRAPEVILSLPWSTKADVWSMACIFFEMYHGGRLFEVDKDANHLVAFERRLGPIPSAMPRRSKHFATFFKSEEEEGEDNGACELLVPRFPVGPQRSLKHIVGHEPLFYDFLMSMLVMDPNDRPTAQEVLQHPFLTTPVSENYTPSALVTAMDAMPSSPAATDADVAVAADVVDDCSDDGGENTASRQTSTSTAATEPHTVDLNNSQLSDSAVAEDEASTVDDVANSKPTGGKQQQPTYIDTLLGTRNFYSNVIACITVMVSFVFFLSSTHNSNNNTSFCNRSALKPDTHNKARPSNTGATAAVKTKQQQPKPKKQPTSPAAAVTAVDSSPLPKSDSHCDETPSSKRQQQHQKKKRSSKSRKLSGSVLSLDDYEYML